MIYMQDCREVEWNGLGDVMITDPPYSEHVHKNATSQSVGGGARNRDLGFVFLASELREWTCQLAAKIPRWSVIFTDIEGAHHWHTGLKSAGATYIRTIPWVRWSMPQLSGDRPPQGCELIILAHGKSKGRKSWNGPGNLTHLAHTCLRGEGKHKTEKPLDMMLDLVQWFSNPGETVIDPFAGSGTTGLASRILGRNFVGSEMDPNWASKADERIKTAELSKRDAERYERWVISQDAFNIDKARRDANTAKTRAKLIAKATADGTQCH
jgi:hypothetical protein